MTRILCVGDMHLKENLSYSDYVSDNRVPEKKNIMDFIVDSSKDCEHIVFLGDNLNSKNNSSETNREFVEFIERFGEKEIYIINGNHEKKGNGSTAIDFLGEVTRSNWHIITKPESSKVYGLNAFFLPYMLNSELDVETSEEATKKIMKELGEGDILFTHHAVSGTSWGGIKVEMFKEVVLPREKLEKKYLLVVGGHIHDPQVVGNTIIAGSLFTDQVGETEKFIYKIEATTKNDVDPKKFYVTEDAGKWRFEIEKLKVPTRPIVKLENPTKQTLSKLESNSIVKVIMTKKPLGGIEEVEKELSRFDAHLLVEDYPDTRRKMKIEEGALDFSIEALLKLYADERKIDITKLLKGLELIS